MKLLTNAEVAGLPFRARNAYTIWAHRGEDDIRVYLINELSHALEKVAAAELMAEGLQSVAYHEELSGDECSVCKRYRDTALAAWKAARDE